MISKPKGPTARARASKRRKDLARQRVVASELQRRDGACRFFGLFSVPLFNHCGGVSEPAHLGEKRRYKTRGQAPEDRHDRRWEVNLCTRHHRAYDAHAFDLEALDPLVGADGLLQVILRPSGHYLALI